MTNETHAMIKAIIRGLSMIVALLKKIERGEPI